MDQTTTTRSDNPAAMPRASSPRPGAAAAADDNAQLVRRFVAAISERDKPASLLDLYTTDEQLKHHVAFFESAFPKYSLIAEDVIAQDDKVAVRARFQGTHRGDLMGMAPTMKAIDVPFIIIYRIADAKDRRALDEHRPIRGARATRRRSMSSCCGARPTSPSSFPEPPDRRRDPRVCARRMRAFGLDHQVPTG